MRELLDDGSPEDLALSLMTAPPLERTLAQLRLARELVEHLQDDYQPPHFPDRPLEIENVQTVDQLRDIVSKQEERGPSSMAAAFGKFRLAVTDAEAIAAGRLQLLVSTARFLLKQIELASGRDKAQLESMLRRVMTHLHFAWRIETPPHEGDLRDWSIRATRRYVLLPRSWRYA